MAKSGLHRGWSCRSSNRPREIDHLALLLHHSPAPSSSAYRRPARFPPALPLLLPPPLMLPLPLLLPDSTIHPRARCIIVRPHRLAHTSSTCPEQASALAHSSLAHTRTHIRTPTTHSPCLYMPPCRQPPTHPSNPPTHSHIYTRNVRIRVAYASGNAREHYRPGNVPRRCVT